MAVLQFHIFYNVLRLKSKHKIISMTFRSRSLPHFGAYSEGYGYGGSLPRHHRPHSSLAEYRGGVADPTSRRSHSSLGEYRQPQSSRYVLTEYYSLLSTKYQVLSAVYGVPSTKSGYHGVLDPTSRRYHNSLREYRPPSHPGRCSGG